MMKLEIEAVCEDELLPCLILGEALLIDIQETETETETVVLHDRMIITNLTIVDF